MQEGKAFTPTVRVGAEQKQGLQWVFCLFNLLQVW